MVRPKKPASSKKPKKGGVDFKKIKRKIGRKLPPPKTATDTQIKSKSIILPEQSIASDRGGLAVNKKGVTLRELLQQTSHHNAKIRKAALSGIADLVKTYPSELIMHKLAIIEKLRERICDNDKMVRETLYYILEKVIFPRVKEDITGPIISVMMAYVFNAMTHMVVDIRLMAFNFFKLIVSSFPSSFLLYADKVLDNYKDILRNNQVYLHDKGKLKNTLGGLAHCLSLLAPKKREYDLPYDLNVVKQTGLHSFENEAPTDQTGVGSVIKKVEDLLPVLVNCFQESTSLIHAMPVTDAQSFDCTECTLRCINLAVKIVVHEINKEHMSSGHILTPLSNGPNMTHITRVILSKLWEGFPIGQMHHSNAKEDELDIRITEIFLHLINWSDDTTFLFEKFLGFIESVLLRQKYLGSIVPFIPGLVSQVTYDWKSRILKAFTIAFKNCKVDHKMSLGSLSAIEEMLVPTERHSLLQLVNSDDDMLGYQLVWLEEFPKILVQLGDKHSSVSKVVLKILLRCEQSALQNSFCASHLQKKLRKFYCKKKTMHYGPFIKLPLDCQELAICCLYYFSSLTAAMLESIACCCLRNDLDPTILLRIIEVLHSAYKAGRVQISDQIAFLVTLVARFQVYPEKLCVKEKDGMLSNRGIFKSLSAAVCSCLSQMGDNFLVLKLVCKSVFNGISPKPSLDNMQGLLKIFIALDARLTKLSEGVICDLGNWVSAYLVDATCYIPESADVAVHLDQLRIFHYYVKPCIFLFCGSEKLLCYVLKLFSSAITVDELSLPSHSDVNNALNPLSRVHAVISVLIVMHNEVRVHRSLSSNIPAIRQILQNVDNFLASSKFSLTFEERHKTQNKFDQLTARVCKLPLWDATNLEEL